jgi:1-acyl-sn-glycerol-3-phosphate acyltransferase
MLFKTIGAVSVLIAALLFGCLNFSVWLLPVLFAGSFLVLSLLAFLFLVFVCALVDMDKPQETDSKFYRTVMYIYIEALVSLVLAKIHATGLEKTPKEGRFLLVCNHLFLADPGVLLHCFRKSQLSFITKQENQSMFVVGKIMHKILCQPLDRNNDRQALKVILKCIQMIKDDQVSIGVFPEGYTSRDGKLHHFRSGVFKIAQKTNVPIVVCTIQNTREIFKNLKKLKTSHIQLHLVDVLQPEDYQGMTTTQISDKVYEMMIADLGEHWRVEE